MKLISNWRSFWRFLSVQITILGAFVTSILITFPDAALATWNALPDDLKSSLPPNMTPIIGVLITLMSIAGRVIKQTKIPNSNGD